MCNCKFVYGIESFISVIYFFARLIEKSLFILAIMSRLCTIQSCCSEPQNITELCWEQRGAGKTDCWVPGKSGAPGAGERTLVAWAAAAEDQIRQWATGISILWTQPPKQSCTHTLWHTHPHAHIQMQMHLWVFKLIRISTLYAYNFLRFQI